ncbi:Uncharacterized protein Adt_16022 [Abeliophyllum distichum]|uniref:DUF4283 domain-containing protein n=1 Tax=Abeliophyllum distichum TaxID=126358 RepID=A0ABD1U454_9LAMI
MLKIDKPNLKFSCKPKFLKRIAYLHHAGLTMRKFAYKCELERLDEKSFFIRSNSQGWFTTMQKWLLSLWRKNRPKAIHGRFNPNTHQRAKPTVLQSAPDSACHKFVAKEPFLHRGEPALTIIADEEASLAEPFKFTHVGKFSHRKPRMVEVRNSFQKFGFTGDFEIGLIDFKHILIHLTHEDDYSRLFLKPLWFIMGCLMRVLKWTCNFHPDAKTLIALVWISFPLLPVHLRAKEFLFALSKLVGVPLRIDEATTDLLRPSEARVCVEVNLELPDRVWIERGESCSFWQPVVYEQLPHFCVKCRHMGHLIDKCRVQMPHLDVEKVAQATKPVGSLATKPVIVPKPTVDPAPKPVID